MIKTINLSKAYLSGLLAVSNCNLEVNEGDVFGFLGLNGAGKTTTIRMLTGLLEPTTGSITINGLDYDKHREEIKSMIGVLPESHGYYPWMTPYEYLEFFYRLYAKDTLNMEQVILDLLKKVRLYERKDSLIKEFSRGMKQRLGLAKTLIHQPKIIFLDEPTLGLDPAGQKEIHEVILELSKKDKVTVFITSHLLKDIEVLCNKIAIIHHGVLLESDEIRNLQTKYSPFNIIKVRTSDNSLAKQRIEKLIQTDKIMDYENELKVYIQKSVDLNQYKKKLIETLFLEKIDIYEVAHEEMSVEEIFMKVIDELGGNINV
ncbi:MAG: ABC transporter ATP-binding protein [Candidatus Izemoplasmatales bacterium]